MFEFLSAPTSVRSQYLLPKRALTQFGGFVAGNKWGFITTRIIEWFIKKYGVNMAEAANPDPRSYDSFNAFFTRALKPEARPLANATWVCPVDGAISQFGRIEQAHIYQAKGHSYTAEALLGGDSGLAAKLSDGHFACLYLSPKDYHRIHMPCAGTLRKMIYVPGDLFSVNPTTAQGVPNLFARNERTVCVFDTEHGPFINVLVGATIVGSMATVWHGVINPPRLPKTTTWNYPASGEAGAIELKQGDEMGRFLLGSTVVMLWPKSDLTFNPSWQSAGAIRMGEVMAN
ncbi:MAG: archaetidylserine decarboxylase [Cytophagales bacterium]|nr:archaetidylserine decarboxylase [Cytophagales bacterium]